MKPKYQGIVSLGLIVLAIGLIGGYSLIKDLRAEQEPGRAPLPSMPKIIVPSEQEVQLMKRLRPRLSRLSKPSVKPVAARPLILFGFQDNQFAADDGPTEKEEAGQIDYQLSLTLLAGNRNYCIIDGAFVAEGAILDDGAQILKVENQRVLIRMLDKEKWIYIDNAAQPAAISNAHASQEKGPS